MTAGNNLRTYGVKAVLAELTVSGNNIPDAKKGKELGQLLAFNIKYALNTIPKATVSLPVGEKLSNAGLEKTAITADKIEALADSHTPVGIYVTVEGSDIDYKTKPLRIPKEEFCLFKGFIEGANYNRGERNVSVTLQLAHWLQILTIFPLVNTMIDPQCVGTIGRSFNITSSETFQAKLLGSTDVAYHKDEGKHTSCLFLKGAYDKLAQWGTVDIWTVLKQILISGMPTKDDKLTTADPGYVSATLFDQIQKVLTVIVGKALDVSVQDITSSTIIKRGVSAYITSLTEQQLSSKTPWEAMVGGILPSFYMALSPSVDKAFVIPIPGQCMDKKSCLKLEYNDYRSITYNRTARPLIGGVMMFYSVKQLTGKELPAAAYRYPIKKTEESRPGPFTFINTPQWLDPSDSAAEANSGYDGTALYRNFSYEQDELKKKTKEQNAAINKEVNGLARILRSIVRSAYQVLSCQGRGCVVVLPFRADIRPGSQVKVQAADIMASDDSKYIYGTVSSVNFVVSSNTADTVIELNNLRTWPEMKNQELTSKTGVLFKDAYHYAIEDNEVLYAK